MPRKKPGWTIDRHRDVALRLHAIRCDLQCVATLLNDCPINSPAQQAAQRAYRAVDVLRCKLENQCGREHPEAVALCLYDGQGILSVAEHRCEPPCGVTCHVTGCVKCNYAGCRIEFLPRNHPRAMEALAAGQAAGQAAGDTSPNQN